VELQRFDQAIVPAIIEQQRNRAKSKGRALRLKRVPRFRSIKGLQRSYLRDLKPLLSLMREVVAQNVVPLLAPIIQQLQNLRPRADSVRLDDFADDIDRAMKEARIQFARKYTPEEIAILIKKHANRIEQFSAEEIDRVFGAVLGIDIARVEPWMATEIKSFVNENVSLIKSIPEQFFDRVEQTVIREVKAGSLTGEIADEIQHIYGVSESRAALIARDQTSKFNGSLNHLRQANVGIKKYIWRTSRDERVRESHAEKEGETFSWDDPPADTGHPGDDINCFLGDSLLSISGRIERGFKRFYTGPIVKIADETGISVSVTPNHPILTMRGWVFAKEIEATDKLFKRFSPDVGRIFDAKIDNRHASASDIFDFLKVKFSSKRIAGLDIQFHGDGSDHEVEIVTVEGDLPPHVFETGIAKKLENRILSYADFTHRSLFSEREFSEMLHRQWFSTNSIMSFANLIDSLGRVHARPLEFFRLASIPDMDSILAQAGSNDIAGSRKNFCDTVLTHARKIQSLDLCNIEIYAIPASSFLCFPVSIKSISHQDASCFVFNFNTTDGILLSNNIITSNCRCTAIPVFEEEASE